MGRVFLGVSPGGRPVAVKAIRAELAANPEFRARFGREVAAARRVSGVFTAQVVDADVDGPVAWMATAYVPGPSLAEAVDTHGPLPEASLLALAAGLAESLNAIHAVGVVHRDLKPSNVLLAEDGPRVIDFGISRAAESTMLTQAGLVVGSPGFMSPEQAMGSDVGPPSDVFNLGAVLAFAATGEGPFGTGTTAALLYRVVHGAPSLDLVPPTVRPLIEHCLAKDPRQRPTANGLLAEVGALQPGGTWLPESFTRTFAQGTPSRPGFAWSGPVAAAAGGGRGRGGCRGRRVESGARRDGFGVRPARRAAAGRAATPAPGSWPYTGAGALTATAGSAPPTPPMGAYPPATPPPMPCGHGPAAAAAPDEAAGAGAHPRRHRRGGRRGRVRGDLVHRAAVHPAGAAGGADILGDGARVRGPGGHVVDDRPVCFAERVLVEFGAVHVAADQHVLVADRAPLRRHPPRPRRPHHVDDTADVTSRRADLTSRPPTSPSAPAITSSLGSPPSSSTPPSSSSVVLRRRARPASPPSSAPSS